MVPGVKVLNRQTSSIIEHRHRKIQIWKMATGQTNIAEAIVQTVAEVEKV